MKKLFRDNKVAISNGAPSGIGKETTDILLFNIFNNLPIRK